VSAPYQTILAAAELRRTVSEETGDCFSFGVSATYDRAGSINLVALQVMPTLAYNKAFRDRHASFLTFGFAGAYGQRSVDPGEMTFDNQYFSGSFDASAATGETMGFPTVRYFDAGAGVSWSSSLGELNKVNYYIGAGAYHLNRPKAAFNGSESFVRLPTRWSGQAGAKWSIDERFALTSHFNYNHQGAARELIGGGLISYRNIDRTSSRPAFTLYTGAFVRFGDAIIPTVKCDYGLYSLTMSYDVNTSSLKPATAGAGGWEMSFYVRGFKKRDVIQTRCPRFEMMLAPYE
jgi:type IX secretion system PorP/SprF family membrane protein